MGRGLEPREQELEWGLEPWDREPGQELEPLDQTTLGQMPEGDASLLTSGGSGCTGFGRRLRGSGCAGFGHRQSESRAPPNSPQGRKRGQQWTPEFQVDPSICSLTAFSSGQLPLQGLLRNPEAKTAREEENHSPRSLSRSSPPRSIFLAGSSSYTPPPVSAYRQRGDQDLPRSEQKGFGSWLLLYHRLLEPVDHLVRQSHVVFICEVMQLLLVSSHSVTTNILVQSREASTGAQGVG